MRLCSIASGSSGNCIYVGTQNTHVLVDTGLSGKKIEQGLKEADLTGNELAGIFITHEHSDHIQGLGVMARRYHIPIYATKGTIEGIMNSKSVGKIDPDLFHQVDTNQDVWINDLCIHPFDIPHDANEPCGYTFSNGKKKIGVATDMGTFDSYIIEKLQGLDAILLEANHDIRMLQVGPYPYNLKQRILSDRGHLSNENSGRLLAKVLHERMQYVILGHLSKDNNMPELAFETVKLEINANSKSFQARDFHIEVAKRDVVGKVLHIA